MTDCKLKEKPPTVKREHPHLQNVNFFTTFFFLGGGEAPLPKSDPIINYATTKNSGARQSNEVAPVR
jgi:hypothetical protein